MRWQLYGIPKVLLRNSIPVSVAKDYVDDYEITSRILLRVNRKWKGNHQRKGRGFSKTTKESIPTRFYRRFFH